MHWFCSWNVVHVWYMLMLHRSPLRLLVAPNSCYCCNRSCQVQRSDCSLAHAHCTQPPSDPLSMLALAAAPAGACAAGAAGAACAHQLAVVWARGPPEPLNNTQQLDYMVRDS
jgi:hypothetical protein